MANDTPSSLVDAEAVAFRVDGVGYRWAHVFAHARSRDDWQILEAEVRQALACLRLAEEEGPPLDRAEERAVATAFRRARRLHAAEDLEGWLAQRGLTVAQWRRYIQGEALRRRHAAEIDTVVARHPPDAEEVSAALPVWGLCAGAFPRWAEALATRAAAAHATCALGEGPSDPPGPDDLEALEATYDRFAAAVAIPERLEALVAARYLDWLRVDCDVAVFANLDIAKEALACVRDDGWSLSEAVSAGRGAVQRRSLLVEAIDADDRHHFVRARDGDLLGPLALADGPTLAQVLRKHAPSLDDEEVALRAAREVIATTAAREVDDRVEWLLPGGAAAR